MSVSIHIYKCMYTCCSIYKYLSQVKSIKLVEELQNKVILDIHHVKNLQ